MDKTLLVFPCDTSVTLAQLAEELKKEKDDRVGNGGLNDPLAPDMNGSDDEAKTICSDIVQPPEKKAKRSMPYDTIVFIESTWNQAHSIFIDERLQKLKRIQLQDYETHFWR